MRLSAVQASLGSENPIARIAQTRQDVAMVIKLTVDGCCKDMHVRVRLAQGGHTFGAGQQTDKFD